MGMLLIPFVISINRPSSISSRYAWISLFILLTYLLIPAQLLLLFAAYTILFFIIESHFGKISGLAPALALCSSPLAFYLFELFGFPIRLQLTQGVANVLQTLGYTCEAQGNMIIWNGHFFSVDPVCMGLNMVLTSFLAAIILMRFVSYKHRTNWSLGGIIVVLGVTLGLVVFSNLIRILLLVLTQAPAETMLHEGIGLSCLLLLVILPLYGVMNHGIKRVNLENKEVGIGNEVTLQNVPKQAPWRTGSMIFLFVLLVSLGVAHWTHQSRTIEDLPVTLVDLQIPDYQRDIFDFDNRIKVLRFTSEQAIIYIKNQDPFRLTNHNPLICWRGSGYEFKNENLLEIGENEVYTATLTKDGVQLYTAWWYDNGRDKTTSNISWRWASLGSQTPYYMVNVTSDNFSTLYTEVAKIMD